MCVYIYVCNIWAGGPDRRCPGFASCCCAALGSWAGSVSVYGHCSTRSLHIPRSHNKHSLNIMFHRVVVVVLWTVQNKDPLSLRSTLHTLHWEIRRCTKKHHPATFEVLFDANPDLAGSSFEQPAVPAAHVATVRRADAHVGAYAII